MIVYQAASADDAGAIALLHAQSWEQHYRNEYTAHYLNHEVRADRLQVWTNRMTNPADNQYVIKAMDGDQLCGFACVFINHNPTWGALVDNLHVSKAWKGRGIGRKLMQAAGQWVFDQASEKPMYLWVLESNMDARQFYERVGGHLVEKSTKPNPGGGESPVLRYVWADLNALISAGR